MNAAHPRRAGVAVWLVAFLVAGAAGAFAQTPRETRFAVFVGPQWVGSAAIGGADAVESANGGTPLTLFETDSTLKGGVGVGGGFAARLTRGLWAEATVAYHPATLTTRVSRDAEGAPDIDVSEGLQQYRVEVGALWMPSVLTAGRRMQLFATAGGGYLRQLHGGGLLVDTGRSLSAGGGVMVWLPRRRGTIQHSSGLRLEGRAVLVDGGVSFQEGFSRSPALSASLFLGF